MWLAIGLQIVFAAVVVGVSAFFGRSAAYSAAAGAAVAFVPNFLFALYLGVSAKPSPTRFFIGELVKVIVAVLISLWVWRNYGKSIEPAAFWVAMIVVLKASGLALLRSK